MRRFNLRSAGLAAAALGLVAAASACQATPTTPEGPDAWCGKKIGIFGAFTGPNAGLVVPSLNGAQLAFEEWNEANPDCELELVEFDSGGSGDNAAPWAPTLAADPDVLGVIGGHFSGESAATQPIFDEAGITMISTSATRVSLTTTGFEKFFRVNGHDGTQSAAIGTFLKAQTGAKAFVIDDATAYGEGLADELAKVLGTSVPFERDKVQELQTQFDATVSKIVAYQPTHVFYAGYAREGAPLFRQIRAAGVTAQLIGADGLYDTTLYQLTEGDAEGAIVTCPCIPADKAGGTFAADFEARFNTPPGSYAAEAYDAATIYIKAITGGAVTREAVLAAVKATDFQGVSKHVKFDQFGDVDPSVVEIWAYEVTATGLDPVEALAVS